MTNNRTTIANIITDENVKVINPRHHLTIIKVFKDQFIWFALNVNDHGT